MYPSKRLPGTPPPSDRDERGTPSNKATKPRSSAVPGIYARHFVTKIALQLFFILLLVEGVLLAEKFAYLLKITLETQASKANVVLLLLYFAPGVFDLALPIALLMAVYLVSLRCREGRELVVLATMGIGARHFIALALAIGLTAQLASLLISGIVEPYSQFGNREVLFQAQNKALRGGIASARFYDFPGHVAYASAQTESTPERPLFIHRALGDHLTRVIASRRARLEGPTATGELTLHLRDLTILDHPKPNAPGSDNATPGGAPEAARANIMRIGSYAQEMILDDLLRFPPRGEIPAEKTSFELLRSISIKANAPGDVAELGRRLARSLLCLITPFIAGLALAFTHRASQAFILPIFCAGLMALDIAASTAVKNFASVGFWTLALTLITTTAFVIAILTKMTLSRQSELVGPALARS